MWQFAKFVRFYIYMNSLEEQILSYIVGIDAILDDLKVTNIKERRRLHDLAAKKMGETQASLLIARITAQSNKAIKEIAEKGGDK